jgi:hypothetical protein
VPSTVGGSKEASSRRNQPGEGVALVVVEGGEQAVLVGQVHWVVPVVSPSAVISRACGIWNGAPARRRVTMTWKSAGGSS